MKSETYRFGVIIVALAATLAASTVVVDSRPAESLARPLESIDVQLGDWLGAPDPPLTEIIRKSLDATSYLSRTYRRSSNVVNLFMAYYANQRAGESMHSPKHCLPGSGWEIVSYGVADLPGKAGVTVNRDVIQKDGSRMEVLYWYQSRRRVIADEYRVKFYLIRDALLEGRAGGAIVRLTYAADPKSAAAGLEFASAIFPELQRVIGDPRAQ